MSKGEGKMSAFAILKNTDLVSGKVLLLSHYTVYLLANRTILICLCDWTSMSVYIIVFFIPGLGDWYWKHLREESTEEETAVQNFPLVPGQHLPRDEDVQRHHRIWSGKLPFLSTFNPVFKIKQNMPVAVLKKII